jgi:4-hydroxythreonine-4-phosphate dehydrogenase
VAAPLAISLGDPAGVGPELIAKAWALRNSEAVPPFCVAGGAGILGQTARICGLDIPVEVISDPQEALSVFANALPVLAGADGACDPGRPSREGAKVALASLEQATGLAIGGAASALLTGPIAKSELANVGFAFPGQTEFVAHACGVSADDAVMMLAGPSLRTVPLTVHCALSEVPDRITQDLILRRCRIVDAAMRSDFGMARPRLAIAGLNPHAGENGRMGQEDAETIVPAIAKLRAEGIDATGPHPADTLFAPHKRETYDIAIAMYHDQALIPLKTLDFDQGVNMTLGLPIIRTSPDHGTAFDIAGMNSARPDSFIAAIRMAFQAAANRAKAA